MGMRGHSILLSVKGRSSLHKQAWLIINRSIPKRAQILIKLSWQCIHEPQGCPNSEIYQKKLYIFQIVSAGCQTESNRTPECMFVLGFWRSILCVNMECWVSKTRSTSSILFGQMVSVLLSSHIVNGSFYIFTANASTKL